MNKTVRYFSLMLMLVSPLFSALLTEDLQVVVPTGMPLLYESQSFTQQLPNSAPRITLRVIETSQGVMLVREYSKAWMTRNTHESENLEGRTRITVCCPSSGAETHGKSLNINVILE